MADHDSPISIQSGGTLAKQILTAEEGGHWPIPEGTILASGVQRTAALSVDVVIVTTLLMVASKQQILNAWNLKLWASSDFHHSLAMAIVLLISHWLYWRWTGMRFSRSLGQKIMGLAVLAEDGSAMTSQMWDQRSRRKLIFLFPIVNIIFGIRELLRISNRHTHQSNMDLHVGSIVAQANSLPPASRRHIK